MRLSKSHLGLLALLTVGSSCVDNTGPKPPALGLISIGVTTSGGDLDDSYVVLVRSDRRMLLTNSRLTVTSAPGPATVQLTDVASNCDVLGNSSITVDVPRDHTVDASFVVKCSTTGFQMKVHTAGADVPPSYKLDVTGMSPRQVPVNSDLLISRLQPGSYTLRLQSPIPSCAISGSNELRVDLPPRSVVPISFEVACDPPVRLEKIAYTIDSTSTRPYIAVVRPDGTDENVIAQGTSASWSPDGRKLAYAIHDCSTYEYYGTYICTDLVRAIDPETLQVGTLVFGTMPAWSPNGDVLATVDANGAIIRLTRNGANNSFTILVPEGLVAKDLSWSPDGRTIAFGCSKDGVALVCAIGSDGTGFRHLTETGFHPVWSADGSTIAFTTSGDEGQKVVATMPAVGGSITILAEGWDASWSRDRSRLIFARADGLFTMNPDGSNVQRVTTGNHRAPAWRP